jgi:hypothetical protein
MPIPGVAIPIRNQMKNELPFMRPMTPVATPNTNAMKMKVTCSEHADGPNHRHYGDHGNHDPRDRRNKTEDELEQDIRRDDQNRYSEQLSGCIRGQLSHTWDSRRRSQQSCGARAQIAVEAGQRD